MSKQVDEFFDELKRNSGLRNELYKIMKMYPEKKVLDNFSVEEQLKFICEVILPFARSHGFEFDLTDIVFNEDINKLGDSYLEEVSGGGNLGRKVTATTLAAINMLTFAPTATNAVAACSVSSLVSKGKENLEKSEQSYGSVLSILESASQKLNPISEDCPLNEVDCLILSTIIYLPMNFVPSLSSDSANEGITIAEWAKNFFEYDKTKNEDLFLHGEDNHTTKRYVKSDGSSLKTMDADRKRLLKLVAESPRYRNIKVGDFASKYVEYAVGKKDSEQFAVATFTLEDGTKFVSFRGTDGTTAGWKEDLDLSWSKKVLAQEHALEYLRKIFELYPERDFFVGGHSKGGNLAIYSSFYLCDESQEFLDKFMGVLNYDGPGLNKDIINDIDPTVFDEVSNRFITYIPQSSLIGRIMDYTSKGQIYCVKSSVTEAVDILLQHDALTWNVSYDYAKKDTKNKFESSEVQPESEFMSKAVAIFVESVDRENAQRFFVQWVFDFIAKNNIDMDDTRSVNEIFRDVFYNYFIKNKSIYDTMSIIFSPNIASYFSEDEQRSFKHVLHTTFSSLLKSYWVLHIELNKKMGLSPEFNEALEKLVKSDYSWSEIYNTAKVVRDDVFTWESIKKFFKKLYGV